MNLIKARSEDHVVSQQRCFSVIIVNFEQIVLIFLVSLFLTLKMYMPAVKWQHSFICMMFPDLLLLFVL